MTPTIAVAALSFADSPLVGTWHASGDLGWMRSCLPMWGFLTDRIDGKIAVSRMAAESVARWLPGDYDVIPNGVVIPEHSDPEDREHRVVFIGRHDSRKGLSVLLRAWPAIHEATGARLRLIGTDPLQYALLQARLGVSTAGIDVLGIVTNEVRSAELAAAKVFVSPALGGESFGLVLVEAFATATPVVASDIPGFADVSVPEAAVLVPPGNVEALSDAVISLLRDEERRVAMGRAARALAVERYSWDDVARRLEEIYERVCA
jgi:phosphatidylinositol alpha-mannosyltransferase